MRYMDKQIQSVYAKQNDVKIFFVIPSCHQFHCQTFLAYISIVKLGDKELFGHPKIVP